MSTKISINLPVKDLRRSTDFFTKVGFSRNPQLSGDDIECLVISEDIYVMLNSESRFKTITKKDVVDTTKSAEAVLQLGVESRHRVDDLVDKALAAGGQPSNEPNDLGFLYGRSFQDLDGHLWDVFYVDLAAMPT